MSGRHPQDYATDPFTDIPHAHFQEPQPRPFESTTSLSQDFGGRGHQYDDEEEEQIEKQPLTGGNVAGGFYPPGCVEHHLRTVLSTSFCFLQANRPQHVWRPVCPRPSPLCCI